MKSQPATEYITRAYNDFSMGPRCATKGYAGRELFDAFTAECETDPKPPLPNPPHPNPATFKAFDLVQEGEGWTLRLEAE